MKKLFLSTLLHAAELCVSLYAAFTVLNFFSLGDAQTALVVGVAVNALLKFGRANEVLPDYVNR